MKITLRRAGLILIPTLIGLSLFLFVYMVVFGPPRPPRGRGLVVEEYGLICLRNPSGVMLTLTLHNDGGEDIMVTAIRVDNKSVQNGPTFQSPVVLGGGETKTLQYIVVEARGKGGAKRYLAFVRKPDHVVEIEFYWGGNLSTITLNVTIPSTCRL